MTRCSSASDRLCAGDQGGIDNLPEDNLQAAIDDSVTGGASVKNVLVTT